MTLCVELCNSVHYITSQNISTESSGTSVKAKSVWHCKGHTLSVGGDESVIRKGH